MAAQVIGAKVRIEVNEEGSYEGYVHNIDGTTKKLTLAKGWSDQFVYNSFNWLLISHNYILLNGFQRVLLLVCLHEKMY